MLIVLVVTNVNLKRKLWSFGSYASSHKIFKTHVSVCSLVTQKFRTHVSVRIHLVTKNSSPKIRTHGIVVIFVDLIAVDYHTGLEVSCNMKE